MKKKVVHYTIAEPCHENWNRMTLTERGRFCNSCAKPVVDFTSMTDFDVMQYMSAAKGSVCGRMTDNQLNRNFTQYEMEHTNPFSMRALVLGAALSTFSALSSCSHKTTKVGTLTVEYAQDSVKAAETPPVGHVQTTVQESVLSGYVKDNDSHQLAGAKVILYDKEARELFSTRTNRKGMYELHFNQNDHPHSLVFIMEGYIRKQLAFTDMPNKMGVVILDHLQAESKHIVGEISIQDYSKE